MTRTERIWIGAEVLSVACCIGQTLAEPPTFWRSMFFSIWVWYAISFGRAPKVPGAVGRLWIGFVFTQLALAVYRRAAHE